MESPTLQNSANIFRRYQSTVCPTWYNLVRLKQTEDATAYSQNLNQKLSEGDLPKFEKCWSTIEADINDEGEHIVGYAERSHPN